MRLELGSAVRMQLVLQVKSAVSIAKVMNYSVCHPVFQMRPVVLAKFVGWRGSVLKQSEWALSQSPKRIQVVSREVLLVYSGYGLL